MREVPVRPRFRASVPPGNALALIVDDEADSLDLYGEMLTHAGYDVLEASDGITAIELATGKRPDIIVMDLCMPRMDGWEAIRRLKRDPSTESIPIIALTGVGMGRDDEAAAAGCEAYLVKPCAPLDLLQVMNALLARD